MVHFVGAGSGAPDLITVRGMRALQQADVVVYAGSLVNPELLEYCRPGTEVHDSAHMTLEEVVAVLVAAERAGRRAVRLHTGDPAMYGAIREQMDLLDLLILVLQRQRLGCLDRFQGFLRIFLCIHHASLLSKPAYAGEFLIFSTLRLRVLINFSPS